MKTIIIFLISMVPGLVMAQSKTTEALQKKSKDPTVLFFTKNTLRMFNQMDSKEFDEAVKDIEKMKFLTIDKPAEGFAQADYKKLKKEYAAETYEEIMTSRYGGRNFDILLKDKKGSKLGTVVLVNDSTNLYVLDILGTIDLKQASKFFSTIKDNTEISQLLKSFKGNGDNKGKKEIHID